MLFCGPGSRATNWTGPTRRAYRLEGVAAAGVEAEAAGLGLLLLLLEPHRGRDRVELVRVAEPELARWRRRRGLGVGPLGRLGGGRHRAQGEEGDQFLQGTVGSKLDRARVMEINRSQTRHGLSPEWQIAKCLNAEHLYCNG